MNFRSTLSGSPQNIPGIFHLPTSWKVHMANSTFLMHSRHHPKGRRRNTIEPEPGPRMEQSCPTSIVRKKHTSILFLKWCTMVHCFSGLTFILPNRHTLAKTDENFPMLLKKHPYLDWADKFKWSEGSKFHHAFPSEKWSHKNNWYLIRSLF